MHHACERWPFHFVTSIFIMKFLRPINGNANQKIVFLEEFAPFIRKQSSVCLNAVINLSAVGIFLLQSNCFFVKFDRAHQCFSSVPREHYLRHGLRFEIFASKSFEQQIVHYTIFCIRIKSRFFKIVTVIARKVTTRSCWFEHHIKRFSERGISGHDKICFMQK